MKSTTIMDVNLGAILVEADLAGLAALKAAEPTPMVVEGHSGTTYVREYVSEGACGFAWVSVRADSTNNRRFINALRKANLLQNRNDLAEGKPWSKAYNGGYQYWVAEGGQSVERKAAFARAYAQVLQKYGIEAQSGSRLD